MNTQLKEIKSKFPAHHTEQLNLEVHSEVGHLEEKNLEVHLEVVHSEVKNSDVHLEAQPEQSFSLQDLLNSKASHMQLNTNRT